MRFKAIWMPLTGTKTTELSILINGNRLSESTAVTMNPRSTSRKEDDLWDLRG